MGISFNTPATVILANGSFPTHEIPLSLLRRTTYLCCCDRAGMTAIQKGYMPDAIVGDGDSLPENFRQRYAAIFHHVAEQDDNDLTKATRFVIAKGFKNIVYLGATGKREDHTLANISLLSYYHKCLGVEAMMVTDKGWFVAAGGCRTFKAFPRQQVSVFNINCTKLQGKGLRWDLYPFSSLWQGTLNEAEDSSFEINGDGEYLIYQTFEAK